MPEIGMSGLMSGGEETWPWLRLRHRHGAKAAGNSYSLKPTAGRASPRLYPWGRGTGPLTVVYVVIPATYTYHGSRPHADRV